MKDLNKKEKIEVLVISQFINDLSFENFRTTEKERSAGDIKYKLNITVDIKNEEDRISQVFLHLFCEANDDKGKVYILEIQYGGNFKIGSTESDAKRTILMSECPKLLFPFLRKIAYDITRDGGVIPLNIQPMNFSAVADKT